jgi:hypothetical protein
MKFLMKKFLLENHFSENKKPKKSFLNDKIKLTNTLINNKYYFLFK